MVLTFKNGTINGTGTQYIITGETRESHNSPGLLREVDIQTTSGVDGAQALSTPPLSNSLFVFPLK